MVYHDLVLLEEVLEGLKVFKGKRFVDATLGDGGHSLEILRLGGEVLGIDYEEGSLERAKERIKSEGLDKNFVGLLGNFENIKEIAEANGFSKVDGILYDLGYSSSQLLDEEIGLSFSSDQALDMRLNREYGVTAKDLLKALGESELERLFREYGEEKFARRYAKAIVANRDMKKLDTTKDLADLLVEVTPPGRDKRLHPATKVFQALRIAVNNEFENLKGTLPQAAHLLLPGGRMAVISFHSLEDRIVKQFGQGAQPELKVVTESPITPSESEVAKNPRARSAKLRIFEKQ